MNEITRLQTGNLSHHQGQQGIGCDVERHTKKDICTSLVKLAGQLAVSDIELEEAVTWRQRHLTSAGFQAVTISRRESDRSRYRQPGSGSGRQVGHPYPAMSATGVRIPAQDHRFVRPFIPDCTPFSCKYATLVSPARTREARE